jgi:hypothetical protein
MKEEILDAKNESSHTCTCRAMDVSLSRKKKEK